MRRAIEQSRHEQAQAARHVDSSHAARVGLSVAQLASLMTRELTAEDYELLLNLDAAVAKKTVDNSTMKSVLRAVTEPVDDDACCMVCLDELREAALSALAALPCECVFHEECIKQWLSTASVKCPIHTEDLTEKN